MAFLPEDDEQEGGKLGRFAGPAILLILIALGIWWFSRQHTAVERQANTVSTLLPVTMPPPPPPPPKPQEVVKEQPTPVPTPQQQQETPKTVAPANNAITENAAPQAGGDAFNIGAGNGGGMTGSGGAGLFNPGLFNAYISNVVKVAVQKDETLKNKTFRIAVSLWLSADGKITRATLRNSTGAQAYDDALVALLMAMPALDPHPPAQILARLPVEMTIDLRKSL